MVKNIYIKDASSDMFLTYVRKAMDTGNTYILRQKDFFAPAKLICFDLDSTLIRVEILNELALLLNKAELMREITQATMYGKLDFKESFIARVKLLEGLPISSIKDFMATIPLVDGLGGLMFSLKKQGVKTAIITGNFNIFAEEIKQWFNFDYCFSSKPNIVEVDSLNGNQYILSGLIDGDIIDAQKKADIVLDLCRINKISPKQVIAVGDGANDIPMLLTAGKSIIGLKDAGDLTLD